MTLGGFRRILEAFQEVSSIFWTGFRGVTQAFSGVLDGLRCVTWGPNPRVFQGDFVRAFLSGLRGVTEAFS